ncbi:hypothetical protein ABPG72_000246 [Tetrahymena utriculariae]
MQLFQQIENCSRKSLLEVGLHSIVLTQALADKNHYFRCLIHLKQEQQQMMDIQISMINLNFVLHKSLFCLIQFIIQILGPILGIFGIWKYRAETQTFIMQKFYLYSSEPAVVGEVNRKQIVLFNEMWEETEKLWKMFLQVYENFNCEILQEYNKKKVINIQEIIERLQKVYLDNQKRFKNIDPREFEYIISRLARIIKRFCCQIILKRDQKTQKVLEYLKKVGQETNIYKDWYKQFAEIKYKFEVKKNTVIQRNSIRNKIKVSSLSPSAIEQESQKAQQINNKNKSIKQKKESKPLNKNQKQEEQKKDKKEEEEVLENLNNTFPQIILKTNLIKETLKVKFPSQQYDMNLLQEILVLEISGICVSSPSRISPAVGESLHLFSHQLLSVEAYKRDQEDSCCYSLKKFLKANYNPIGLKQNNPLPYWLHCQIISGIIHLWGAPKATDESEILIKIVDQLSFTILSFHLTIKDKEGFDVRDKSSTTVNKVTSGNNLVSSLRIFKQNLTQSPTQQKSYENKSKAMQLIPRLNQFSKDISTQTLWTENPNIKVVKDYSFKEQNNPQNQKEESESDQQQLPQQNSSYEKNYLKENSIEINMIDCSKHDKYQEEQEILEDEIKSQISNIDEKSENEIYQQTTVNVYKPGK